VREKSCEREIWFDFGVAILVPSRTCLRQYAHSTSRKTKMELWMRKNCMVVLWFIDLHNGRGEMCKSKIGPIRCCDEERRELVVSFGIASVRGDVLAGL
jgi:hypothetical protein